MNLQDYLKKLEHALQLGNATEHTYRPALKSLLESIIVGITATNEPKRVKCGAPDYIVTKGETPLGYIEAKDLGKALDKEEKSEQMKRYLESLGNLILTDYLEFRWYVQGKLRLTARLAKLAKKSGKLSLEKGGADDVFNLLKAFLTTQTATVSSPKDLAKRMAAIARLIREAITKALNDEDLTDEKADPLHDQLKGFQEVLLHDLTEEQFADMYAQTICYGLFAARCNVKDGSHFSRKNAAYDLPKTNPFLRKMFSHIAGPDLDERISWAVDDLAELLQRADIAAILQDFGKRTRREDPVVHFYETFLTAYDPKMREARGVYYTPEPVVSYIVRSVDHLLKTDFKLAEGLADSSKIKIKNPYGEGEIETHKVLVLDPATGTGTFLYSVIKQIWEKFGAKNKGMWSGYVSEHLLPRIFGFELLMAAYSVAHMKLGLLLDETGYGFQSEERLRVYLTNTLDEVHQLANAPTFTKWINEEADEAGKVKQDKPVMVVIGNPPYSGHSANQGQWIAKLLHGMDTHTGTPTGNYFAMDGQPLGEKNPKWLNDDYVKFIRFAQWRIEQTGYGVLAFITNHGYLDNPTFRGMRQSLMETFDDIYLLDLHGNSKKKERSPDGSKDENVFDIQQGVAIGIFVKRGGEKESDAVVHHAHLWGVREVYEDNVNHEKELVGGKYHWLSQHDLRSTEWKKLEPQSPFYLFVPQDTDLLAEYEGGWKVTEMMPINVLGFQTHRDHFAIDFDEKVIRSRIADLRDTARSDDELRTAYELRDNRDWQLSKARRQLRDDKHWQQHFIQCLYRPFDWRPCYFSNAVMDYPRRELLDHVAGKENLCLLVPRQISTLGWQHIGASKAVAESCLVSTKTKEQNYNFPLYIYPVEKKGGLFDTLAATNSRHPNLAPEFIKDFATRLQLAFVNDGKGDLQNTFAPEDVFNYMYAVFHSPTYRSRYAEFLKIDFPRLPLTANIALFRALCASGERLVALHLLESFGASLTGYPIAGDNTVEEVRYNQDDEADNETGRVWINKEQYFDGVPQAVWNFHIGGYQVCQKWLKDRKGRKLTYDDLTHYQRIVAALSETIGLMAEIDQAIEQHGGWPIQ
ncbi:MAG: N-6 DNA methylase [Acidobacteria bacterium]|nr:N-6 DNA methylase [Acidobacteriota bacterium]